MSVPSLVRFFHPDSGVRVGVQIDNAVMDVTADYATPGAWLQTSVGRVDAAIEELSKKAQASTTVYDAAIFENAPDSGKPHWLAPVLEQDVWAAGVTYERSREARQEEATDGGDVYARVYDAPRPELFFKAQGKNVVGHLDFVGIRADATWNVPEPELIVVLNSAMEIVGFSAGNDMSSRDIEGENPLYLPQAKVYTASCSIGKILLQPSQVFPKTMISITIRRGGKAVFEGSISTERIKRTIAELVEYLGRSNTHPDGVALFTGTGVVPGSDFTLAAGDEVEINIEGIASLTNTVKVV